MSGSTELERKLKTFTSVGDIVSAMKAYAGVTIKRTDDVVPNVRAYEENVLTAMADVIQLIQDDLFRGKGNGRRLVVAFGSSQGLCGPYNEHVAERLAVEVQEQDTLFVIGGRLRTALDPMGISIAAYADSPVSISGIRKALEGSIARIMDMYGARGIYTLTLAFTHVRNQHAEVVFRQILPPDIKRIEGFASPIPPMSYMEPQLVFERVLEEFLQTSLYQAYLESLRSENWYRLNVLEGAADSLNRRLQEIRTLKNYIRQEEITEEMLEILQSGMFFR